MPSPELKLHSLTEMKDKYLGKLGSEERDHYEYELRMEVLGKMIKSTRQERRLTQEELGQLVGVQKAQISKLESSANSATVDTLLKIFTALRAEINFSVKLDDRFVKLQEYSHTSLPENKYPNSFNDGVGLNLATKKNMKTLLLLCFFSLISVVQAQEKSSLFQELKAQDSIFFERGFNRCDLDFLKAQVADDLRFYHDQGGFQDKTKFLESTANNICGSGDKKPIRKVAPESLEVFPLYTEGKLYGAIQTGMHYFYIREKDKKDLWTSTAKFTHVWIIGKGTWKLTEVLSYDHQSETPPSVELP